MSKMYFVQRRFCSLIRIAFTQSNQNLHWEHLDSQGCKCSSPGQRRLWSDCTDAQADLSLCWAHMSEGTFSHIAAQMSLGPVLDI